MIHASRLLSFLVLFSFPLGMAACSKKPTSTGTENTGSAKPGDKKEEPAPVKKTDADLIQGTWKLEWTEMGGTKEAESGKFVVIFTGNQIIRKELSDERVEPHSFKLDPSKTPKTIDIILSEVNPNDAIPAIYELDGDQLKMCFVRELPPTRPSKFESPPGSNAMVWTLKRDKNAPEYKEPDTSGYPTAIIGKWKPGPVSSGFLFGLSETEFTKDGRVLLFNTQKKEWVEKYKYRFDKSHLVLMPIQGQIVEERKDGSKAVRTELRMRISKLTGDHVVAEPPMAGELKRIK